MFDCLGLCSLENTSSLSVAPLASNESDDDIEDEKKDHENAARDGCEDRYVMLYIRTRTDRPANSVGIGSHPERQIQTDRQTDR